MFAHMFAARLSLSQHWFDIVSCFCFLPVFFVVFRSKLAGNTQMNDLDSHKSAAQAKFHKRHPTVPCGLLGILHFRVSCLLGL